MNAMILFSSPQNTEAADLLKYFHLGAQLCLTCSLVTVGQLLLEVHQPLQSCNSSQWPLLFKGILSPELKIQLNVSTYTCLYTQQNFVWYSAFLKLLLTFNRSRFNSG